MCVKKSDFNFIFANRVGYNWNSDDTSVFVIGRINLELWFNEEGVDGLR